MSDQLLSWAFIFGPPMTVLLWSNRDGTKIQAVLYLVTCLAWSHLDRTAGWTQWLPAVIASSLSSLLLLLLTLIKTPLIWRVVGLFSKSLLRNADLGLVKTGFDQKYIRPPSDCESDLADVDIVAVNGLGAHPEWTWRWKRSTRQQHQATELEPTLAKNGVSWPLDLLPRSIGTARIMQFRQDSSWLVNAPIKNIEDCGRELLDGLITVREKKKEKFRPLILIGHSFGGIVIKQALVFASQKPQGSPARAVLDSTCGIVFLGTPHRGAWPSAMGSIIADCAAWLSISGSIMEDLGYKSPRLEELSHQFNKCYGRRSYCFYEMRRTFALGVWPVMMVDKESATRADDPNCDNKPFDTDHGGLNKFRDEDDDKYKAVVEGILDMTGAYQETETVNGLLRRLLPDIDPYSDAAWAIPESKTKVFQDPNESKKELLEQNCKWIRHRVDIFCSQLGESSKPFIICGGPGTGKSTLSQFILKDLNKSPGQEHSTKVAYFIFDSTEARNCDLNMALRTLLYQLLSMNRGLHKLECFKRFNWGDQAAVKVQRLWEMLQLAISDARCSRVVILIDGLDECRDAAFLLEKFRDIADGPCDNIAGHFIVATQRFPELDRSFPDNKVFRTDLNSLQEVKNAVARHVDYEVTRFVDDHEFGVDIKKEVQQTLRREAKSSFLYVDLVMKQLRQGLTMETPGYVLEELESLSTNGNMIELYEKIFKRQLAACRDAVTLQLPWILLSPVSLTVVQLGAGLAMHCFMEKGRTLQHWLASPGRTKKKLDETFGSLVTVDASSEKIELFHPSLKAALLGKSIPINKTLSNICERKPGDEHARICATCLSYIALPKFSNKNPRNRGVLSEVTTKNPFLKYAAQYWPYHAREAGEDTEEIWTGFQKLMAPELASNAELALHIYSSRFHVQFEQGISLLSQLAYMGLGKLAIAFIKRYNININETTGEGRHALHQAAAAGTEELLDYLLANGVPLDLKDQHQQTVLHYAAQEGRKDLVKRILDNGLRSEVNVCGLYGYTPLHHAANHKHLDVIEVLLDNGADATISGDRPWAYTPLKLLLQKAPLRGGEDWDRVISRLQKAQRAGCETESVGTVVRLPGH